MTARLAVSNLAWDSAEDDEVARLLTKLGVTGVELAPTKWRDDPFAAPLADVRALRRQWSDRGLNIVSLQSLLFGRPELQLFGSTEICHRLADYLRSAIDFAAELGAGAMVFGSPRNRLRGALPNESAMMSAAEFLRDIGEHAANRDVVFCIEANPPQYGGDFITTTVDAVTLCQLVANPAVRVNGDLGGMTLSGESPANSIALTGDLLGHYHISEPNLAELRASADHASAARGLAAIAYAGCLSIEMRASSEDHVAPVERAVRFAKYSYGV
jgi:D-psicose/D-tagatose/L-ribulose 3-epimerase